MSPQTPSDIVRHASTWSILCGALLIVLGMLAVGSPALAAVVDGIITLLLGLLIYLQWPSSASWAIGTLVGVSLIISGVTRLMLSLAVRKVTAQLASLSSGKAA
jgi:uncharacterized membrane protein HdeD (DUF308 family)